MKTQDGQAIQGMVRPQPGLTEAVSQELFKARLFQVEKLSPTRILAPLFHSLLRGGTKGHDVAFCLLDEQGRLLRTLEGIDPKLESPYVDHRYSLVVVRQAETIVYSNKFALYLWDFEGDLLHKQSLEDKAFKALSGFQPFGCTSDGRLAFVHPKQHRFFLTPPIQSHKDVPEAIVAGLAAYKKSLGQLKKQYQKVKNRWLCDLEASVVECSL